MTKFFKRPIQANYASQFKGALSTMLEGPASMTALEKQLNTRMVTVAWQFDALGYQYARSFFRTTAQKGAKSFTIDLILENNMLSEYTAFFNSWRLTSFNINEVFNVQADLEVRGSIPSADNVAAFVLGETFGVGLEEAAVDMLSKIVNEDWPERA